MALFQELNEEGVTILIVTHEPDIACYAKRLVEVRDGRILRDEPMANRRVASRRPEGAGHGARMRKSTLIKVATQSILKNKMRTFLTMLGIVIGVAAVIVMVAVGYGAQESIQKQIGSLGTNMIMIMPGASAAGGVNQGAGDLQSPHARGLREAPAREPACSTRFRRSCSRRLRQSAARATGARAFRACRRTIRRFATGRSTWARSLPSPICAARAKSQFSAARWRSSFSRAAIPSVSRCRSGTCRSR